MDNDVKLKRKIYDKMLDWKRTRRGKTALLIEGARRVGKSTIVCEFAKNEYDSYCLIDFNEAPQMIKDLFVNERDDLDMLFNTLETYYKVELEPRKSLIIFDEVQLWPAARSLIKYLVADGRYDYIETGSLINLKKNVKDIVIPSEEERLNMYPLDFEEFLWAMGDEVAMPFIRERFQSRMPVGAIHREIMKRFRKYILVGGMPQSVIAYMGSDDFENADIMKRSILKLYREDIHKYANDKVVALFSGIPGQLSKHSKRYQLASISESARIRDYDDAFTWLKESMLTNLCYAVSDPSVGLALTEDRNNVKCYLGDTGLLVSQAFENKPYLDNDIYRDILLDKLSVNEGMIMENYVMQALVASGYTPYYYSHNDEQTRENDMEVDFIISINNKLNPIEVKSGNYTKHSSLDKFKQKYGKQVGERYVFHPKDLSVRDDVVYLPLYMAGLLGEF